MAAFCAASVLASIPGVSVYAADLVNEEMIESSEELPGEAEEVEELSEKDSAYEEPEIVEEAVEPSALDVATTDLSEEPAETVESVETDVPYSEDSEDAEETVGAIYTVGNGVQASFYLNSGRIMLFNSDAATGGTLWSSWLERAGIDRDSVKSISVRYGSGTPKIKLPADSKGTDGESDCLFGYLRNLTEIDLAGFDTSNVTNMRSMFMGCSSLKTIDLSSINTSKVTDMSWMFNGCKSLTTISLSGLNMSNVTTMGFMFEDCESLKTANLSGLNTLKLTNMRELFYCCRSLEQVNLSGLKTSNVTDMSYMFGGCESLKTLDLKGLNTSKVTEMSLMFEECLNLTRLDLSGFKAENVKYADRMFRGCSKLKYLDLYGLDFTKADTEFMFKGCNALDILITPAKVNKDNIVLPHAMYDRSGKKYTELSNSTRNKVLGRTKALAASIFIDVRDPSHAYYKAIYWAVEKGITKGYPDGTFGINKACTRGEMVMFLWRYAGKPKPKYMSKSPFKDVPMSHVFYKAILWAYQKGITKGYPDGTFGINRNVSRGESMMFLWRLKGKPEPKPVSVSPFKDVPKTHTFYKAILWGYQKKITNGYTTGVKKGTFGINENCTRGQIVTFLYRARAL